MNCPRKSKLVDTPKFSISTPLCTPPDDDPSYISKLQAVLPDVDALAMKVPKAVTSYVPGGSDGTLNPGIFVEGGSKDPFTVIVGQSVLAAKTSIDPLVEVHPQLDVPIDFAVPQT